MDVFGPYLRKKIKDLPDLFEKTKTPIWYASFMVLFCMVLGVIFYYFIRYVDRFYFVHYFEYYTTSALLSQYLKTAQLESFFSLFFSSYVDKLIFLRALPFFLLFGPSHFMFFYSNAIFNLVLLMLLYRELSRIYKGIQALIIILLFSKSLFFLHLMASFYIDLTYFFLCSLFFIHLYRYDKNPKKSNVTLAVLVFLLFLAKNLSYFFLPFIALSFVIRAILLKRKSITIFRLLFIFLVGFFFYFGIAYGFNTNRLELIQTASYELGPAMARFHQALSSVPPDLFKFLTINHFMFYKFAGLPLNILIYLGVLYLFIFRKAKFWISMFIMSEVYLFLFYNVKGHYYALRFFLPFYLIYICIFFEVFIHLTGQLKRMQKIFVRYALFLFILGFFFMNLFILVHNNSPSEYPGFELKAKEYEEMYSDVFYSNITRPYSFIGVENNIVGSQPYILFSSETDKLPFDEENSKMDRRFMFKVTDRINESEYWFCSKCNGVPKSAVLLRTYDLKYKYYFYSLNKK